MRSFLSKNKYQIILFFIIIVLFLINYKSGSYLLGWDSLQTELNPGLAAKRAFFSVWEEYQSFGLLAGMAHASDLIRALLLWFLSFVIPQNLIRYSYHFFMLFLGGLGMSVLLGNGVFGFLGALFYILNLGTVQVFFLPFEPFSTFFAFLPWGIWSFYRVTYNVEHKTFKKNLIQFLLINLLGTPSFYTQQLFVVYILILGLLSFGIIWKSGKSKTKIIKNTFLSFLLIFIINSFWILPQIYFVKTSSNVVFEAKGNQLATEDTYFQSKDKGTLPYFLKLEGFYFNLLDKNNKPLFLAWQNHFKKLFPIQYFFAFLMILGFYYSFKEKDYLFLPAFFLLTIIFLNNTLLINLLDSFWRSNKLLNQIFRSSFTKFIVPYSLIYSYFFIKGLSLLRTFLKKDIFFLIIFILLIIYSLPAFKGDLISSEMKVKIPPDYFEVINYFKNKDKNKRIALLPEYTFWGWYQHKWGYNGSGFLWYGIEQPIVSRTFDVWSNYSESYFWEIKKAITEENLFKFEKMLEKYQIDYLLLDLSLKPISGSYKGIQYDQILNLLEKSPKVKLIKKGRYLRLYQVRNNDQPKNFVTIKNNLISAGSEIRLTDDDELFYRFGDYFVDKSKTPDIYFPFLDLTTLTRLKNKIWQIKEEKNQFVVEAKMDFDLKNYSLANFQPQYQALTFKNEILSSFSANLNYQKENNSLKVFFDKILIKKINQNEIATKKNCFKNTDCLSINLPFLPQKYGYLLKIKNKNLSGRRLFFYVLDETKKNTYLEERLKNDVEYFILSESYQYGLGYSVVFHNQSYQNLKSKNEIESIEVYLLPYQNLKSLLLTSNLFHLTTNRIQDITNESVDFNAKKIAYFFYQISNFQISPNQSSKILYLSQSYYPGWLAIADGKILEHIKVNNWANGWKLNGKTWNVERGTKNIVIVFWPQYLEYLGFALLIIAFLIIIFKYDTTLPPPNP